MKKPNGVTPDRLAALLSKAFGSEVDPDFIRADVAADAPTNPDGTINLIRYAAWLLKNGNDDRT